jgi:hypothetical protein
MNEKDKKFIQGGRIEVFTPRTVFIRNRIEHIVFRDERSFNDIYDMRNAICCFCRYAIYEQRLLTTRL